ncbi:DeoR/GlpR family DNA-binding transcription regulator [Catenisphaera adipataccumulans]|uniref:DeoR/GlpR family transcriptional regulator of sugar metabolism n=1 Tax=Catenisphaera adipataccumulans TaxID=700500 RepID=A0A7W8FV47_9FIRM|nr:DeoR/GlpR family DNA-binding transcription regulator [Catenisphaera adipataccumulans]MBB5182768.1 DeoR/GlpR family transcriptional regulator of sugar metabolism [Catenisphaera adipataccumulans]
MNKQARQQAIMDMLSERDEILIATICRHFDVVPMTARRDLKELEQKGLVIRTHGGAVLKEKKIQDTETSLLKRSKQRVDEKRRIAQTALTFVHENERLFIASGSTINIFGLHLMHTMPLTIVTNAINIAYHLSTDDQLHLIVIGGELRKNSLTLTGPMALHDLQQFRLDAAFIGINAVDETGRLYCSSVVESDIVESLFETVPKIYVLADTTKMMQRHFVPIHSHKPYTLITTYEFTAEAQEPFEKKGIEIVQCL